MSEAGSPSEDGIGALLGIVETLRAELVAAEARSRAAIADRRLARAEALALRDRIATSERSLQELRATRDKLCRLDRPGLWKRIALLTTPTV